MKPDFKSCCREVAEKTWPNKPELIGWFVNNCTEHHAFIKAAQLYADRCVEEATRWIPVSERQPEENEWVLCASGSGTEVMFRRSDDDWFGPFGYAYETPTHWMPIPKLPKPTQP